MLSSRRSKTAIAIFLLLVVVLGAYYFFRGQSRDGGGRRQGAEVAVAPALDPAGGGKSAPPAAAQPPAAGSGAVPWPAGAPASAMIEATYAFLQAPVSRESAAEVLSKLRGALVDTKAPARHAEAIVAFLDSGRDVATQLPFTVGPDHFLSSAPTLRTELLDILGSLEPALAGDYAGTIFDEKRSADEWAIALRHLARSPASGRDELDDRFLEMLGTDAWRADPSAGFLHAMDVPVFLGAAELAPLLAAQVAPETAGGGLSFAASLALDRLALTRPAETLPVLESALESLDAAPLFRAGVFARADAADPRQLATLELYLTSPGVGDEEAREFLALFPNANVADSHNLLTDPVILDYAAQAASDRAALIAVRQWSLDPRFAGLADALQAAEKRIGEYVAAAEKGGVISPAR